jgi:hypothetical protein
MIDHDARRLYKNVHKLMLYWFARIMLETDWNGAMAFKTGMRAEEFRSVRQHHRRKRYWELRNQGLSSYEARAILDGTTPAVVKRRSNTSNRRQAERLGGYPKAGTNAYNRWLMAR